MKSRNQIELVCSKRFVLYNNIRTAVQWTWMLPTVHNSPKEKLGHPRELSRMKILCCAVQQSPSSVGFTPKVRRSDMKGQVRKKIERAATTAPTQTL